MRPPDLIPKTNESVRAKEEFGCDTECSARGPGIVRIELPAEHHIQLMHGNGEVAKDFGRFCVSRMFLQAPARAAKADAQSGPFVNGSELAQQPANLFSALPGDVNRPERKHATLLAALDLLQQGALKRATVRRAL